MTDLEIKVLEYSIKRHWGHIPSALTQVEYIYNLINNPLMKDYKWVAGKPFGAQAWYVATNAECDEVLLQHPYVSWNCQTIGHSLGYSLGLSTGCKVWLNISDASLETGDFWEALSLWHKIPHQDLFVTVDYNGFGCKTETPCINDIKQRIKSYNVGCSIVKPNEVKPGNGIFLVDTTETLGAKLKHLGFHYTKFESLEDFYAQYNQRMVERT